MSDNGYSLGSHRHRFKNCMYEECARIPLCVHGPGVPAGTDDHLVSNADVTATIVDYAGMDMGSVQGHQPNGRSLRGLLEGDVLNW